MDELIKHKIALKREIAYLTTQLREHDTGHIRTAINVLEQRVKDIDDFVDGIHHRAFEFLEARDKSKHDDLVVKHEESVNAMMAHMYGSL